MDVFTLLSFGIITLSMGVNILVTRDGIWKSEAGVRVDRSSRILFPTVYFGGLLAAYFLR